MRAGRCQSFRDNAKQGARSRGCDLGGPGSGRRQPPAEARVREAIHRERHQSVVGAESLQTAIAEFELSQQGSRLEGVLSPVRLDALYFLL